MSLDAADLSKTSGPPTAPICCSDHRQVVDISGTVDMLRFVATFSIVRACRS